MNGIWLSKAWLYVFQRRSVRREGVSIFIQFWNCRENSQRSTATVLEVVVTLGPVLGGFPAFSELCDRSPVVVSNQKRRFRPGVREVRTPDPFLITFDSKRLSPECDSRVPERGSKVGRTISIVIILIRRNINTCGA